MPSEQLSDDDLKDVLDRFNQHDLDGIMASFAQDAVFESPRGRNPWGTRFEGREAVREGLAARFEGIPDVHYGDDKHFVWGASEWMLTGTTTDGVRLEVRGLIIRKDSYWKSVESA